MFYTLLIEWTARWLNIQSLRETISWDQRKNNPSIYQFNGNWMLISIDFPVPLKKKMIALNHFGGPLYYEVVKFSFVSRSHSHSHWLHYCINPSIVWVYVVKFGPTMNHHMHLEAKDNDRCYMFTLYCIRYKTFPAQIQNEGRLCGLLVCWLADSMCVYL